MIRPKKPSPPTLRLLLLSLISLVGSMVGWWAAFVFACFIIAVGSSVFRGVVFALLFMMMAHSVSETDRARALEQVLELVPISMAQGVGSDHPKRLSSPSPPLRSLVAGSLVMGDVQSVEPFGAFVVVLQTGYGLQDRLNPIRLRIDFGSLLDSSVIHGGDRVMIDFLPEPIQRPRNPHDPATRSRTKVAFFHGVPSLLVVDHVHTSAGFGLRQSVQELILDRISARFTGDVATLIEAMVLGRRHRLDPAVKEAFVQSGVVHLLAVSGLHFGILIALLSLGVRSLVNRLPARPSVRRMIRTLLMIVGCLSFAMLIGWSPSVLRATVMILGFILALHSSRPRALKSSLVAAFFIMVTIRPDDLSSAGMHLSFLAVGGISAGLRLNQRARRQKGSIENAFIISSCASVASAPAVLWHIGLLPLVTLLASPVLIPVTSVALSLSVLALLMPVSIDPFNQLASWSMSLLMEGAKQASSTVFLPVLEAERTLVLPFAVSLFLTLLLPFLVSTWRVWWLVFICFVLSCCLSFLPGPRLTVTFLDVGQGDSSVIRFPDRSVLVVDTGPGMRAGFSIRRHLQAQSMVGEPTVILSHGDRDHTGGLPALYESSTDRPVLPIITKAAFESETTGSEKPVLRGQRLLDDTPHGPLPSYRVYVLHPDRPGDDNNDSVVLLVCFGTTRILFTGDIESETESVLVEQFHPMLSVDVLKVAHHGSSTSSSNSFLDIVKPAYAVISAGLDNAFGHPDSLIVERLLQRNIRLFTTSTDGAITLSSNGKKIEMVSWLSH